MLLITRRSSTFEFPVSINVIRVDDDYPKAQLTSAFAAHDAVILSLNTAAEKHHNAMVDASIAAGVHRLIPSVFGGRHTPAAQAIFPVARAKAQLLSYVASRAAQLAPASPWSYTALCTGPFHELSLRAGFYDISPQTKRATLWDDGTTPFSVSTYAAISQAVLAILRAPDEARNQIVYVSSFVTSQAKLLSIYKDVCGAEGWNVEYKSCEEGIASAKEDYAMARDRMSGMRALGRLALLSSITKGGGADFDAEGLSCNARLGVEGEDVKVVTRAVLQSYNV
ncbi:hypothetical protein SLS60_011618 [Paraconiothyrium brasiliense]|uniref:NmrA-like domain-containing protein n=1 Tax=Paraconiothyrium brasiliense TaxID=300254 RepID=A0ABR3QIP4_9PLEO